MSHLKIGAGCIIGTCTGSLWFDIERDYDQVTFRFGLLFYLGKKLKKQQHVKKIGNSDTSKHESDFDQIFI